MQKLKFSRFSGTFITNAILIVLFIVFILETIMGGSTNINTLLRLGAMNNQLVTVEHQWWRLFTAQFLHIGWLHIASNAVMIYYIGQFMEPLLGHWRFLSVYLLSGIGGNLLSYAYGSDSVVSVGASTALFGLFGVVIALYLFASHIDILGHLGGLISGFLLGIIFGSAHLRQYHHKLRVIAAVITIIYVVFCLHQGIVINN